MDVADVETLLVVAQLHELVRAPARALRCYTAALALQPSDIEVWLRLVRRTLFLNIRYILHFDRRATDDLFMYCLRSTRYRYKHIDRSKAFIRFYDALINYVWLPSVGEIKLIIKSWVGCTNVMQK